MSSMVCWRLSRTTNMASASPAAGSARAAARSCGAAPPLALLALVALALGQRGVAEAVDLGHQRAADLHRVVLLGLGAEVGQVVGRVVDAADEGDLAVDHHDLAVHAAQQVRPQPKGAGRGRTRARARRPRAAREEARGQVGRAPAVDGDVDLHAAPGGGDQRLVQLQADLVLEQDEGLDDHLALGVGDAGEHAREELLAVLQQGELVARIQRRSMAVSQRWISATSGAWSDRCDQGRRGSTTGRCTEQLRT
jgi:hypothetical protein